MTERTTFVFHLCRIELMCPSDGPRISPDEVGEHLLSYYEERDASERIHGEGQEDKIERELVDKVSKSGGVVRGIVLGWDKDAHIETVRVPETGRNVKMEQVGVAKKEGDKFAEFVRCSAYFAMKGDYIAYVTRRARASVVEEILSVILTNRLKKTITVSLLPIPSPQWKDEDLKKIVAVRFAHEVETESQSGGRRYRFSDKTKGFLGSLFADSKQRFTADISGILVAEITIKPKAVRNLDGESRRALADVAKKLRDFPNVKLVLSGGRTISKETIAVAEKVRIDTSHRIPNSDTMLEKLSGWLIANLPDNAND